jgi:hypothetical protein
MQQDPLASFGWRGASDVSQVNAQQSGLSQQLAHVEDDQVPMLLEPTSAVGLPTSPKISDRSSSSFVTTRARRATMPSDSSWVTIFGVQSHQTALAKAQVEQLLSAEIVDIRPGGGNFFHARFPTTSDARSALNLNGHMLDGNLIIGVTPCVLTSLDDEALPSALAAAAALRRKTLVPTVAISKQPSLIDPFWNLLDKIFQYN